MDQGEMIETAARWAAHRLLHGSLAAEVTVSAVLDCPFCGLFIRRRYTWHPPASMEAYVIMFKIASTR